ncbi:MAG: hypothetical protein JEZ06_11890 [Anaerolineaceae bacterium]|nr:hypothetical protein [Anaerolineaceae bacterium]
MPAKKGNFQKTAALMCPQCNAPLTPHRFARSAVCGYCGATVHFDESTISAARFHKAYQHWNNPQNHGFPSWISIGSRHWMLERLIAKGERSDVYTGRLARWPTELVLLKILREGADPMFFERGWQALQMLIKSNAPGTDHFNRLIPQPVMQGMITAGKFSGRRANIYRWQSGFEHTFEDVMQAYPQGISPRASIWVWRRILEMLTFIHNSGMVHAALVPAHLMLQKNEHGVRLIGYNFAGLAGDRMPEISPDYARYYPQSKKSKSKLTPSLDIVMSARCMMAIVGGDLQKGTLPEDVPLPLAELILRIALVEPGRMNQEAWVIREELGKIAGEFYGAPQFIPIKMPEKHTPDRF